MPIDFSDSLIDAYVEALKKEIDHYAKTLKDKGVKTLYFGGGTPSRIGSGRIIDIIEHIRTKFDFEGLAELSIELNPYPEEEVLDFVQSLNKKYGKISRLRYSFGIQSFDDEVLKITGRAYSFASVVDFLRALSKHKQGNNVFNFDFIAFGKFHGDQLRNAMKIDFFTKFLESGYADSISLYTLENIKDKDCPKTYYGTDEEIMKEFTILKNIIQEVGFQRYEISNFARAGKTSIHNMVYRNMEPYIGCGLSASSFFGDKRWTNTGDIKQYIGGHRADEKEVQILDKSDLLIEEFFLRLRTREGIADITKFISVLVPNYQGLIANYIKAGLVHSDGVKLQLTNEGMNVSNSIITDLLQQI